MPISNYMPDVKVEIAFNAGYATPAASRIWTDVSDKVELTPRIPIVRGRADELAIPDPNRITLTLDNSDGRFTAGRAASPYYPNVKIGRPIRVKATPVGGSESVRYLGYIDDWPTEWNETTAYASATISATSRLARFGIGNVLSGVIEQEFLFADPDAYFPGTEAQSAPSAADATGKNPALTPMPGQVVTFGTTDGPRGTPAMGLRNVKRLESDLTTPITDSAGGFLIECFAKMDSRDGPMFVQLTDGTNNEGFDLFYLSGDLRYVVDFASSDVDIDPGRVYHVALHATHNGVSTRSLDLYLDGVLVASDTRTVTPKTFTTLRVETYSDPPVLDSGADFAVSHIAINADLASIADRAEVGLVGLGSESAADRIGRYAEYAGMDLAEYSGGAGTQPVDEIDTAGKTVIEAMRLVEATEGGVLYDARDNTLTLRARSDRYVSTVGFTLDASAEQIGVDFAPKLDRTGLVNDATVTGLTDASTARAVDQDSVDDYGPASTTAEIAGNYDRALERASFLVGINGEPEPRAPTLTVNLLNLPLATQTAILAADIGTRVTVNNLPSQAPTSSATYFIEGYTETIGHESYSFTFNVSPTTGFDVWTLEDPVLGAYDSAPLAY